jgi:hypothetical protein
MVSHRTALVDDTLDEQAPAQGQPGVTVGHETSGLVKRRNSTSTRRVDKPLWSVLLAIAIAQTRVPDATSATSEQE